MAETLTLQQAADLMGGKWQAFSLDGLLHMAGALGWSIKVEMDEPPAEAVQALVAKHAAPQPPRRRRTSLEAVTA